MKSPCPLVLPARLAGVLFLLLLLLGFPFFLPSCSPGGGPVAGDPSLPENQETADPGVPLWGLSGDGHDVADFAIEAATTAAVPGLLVYPSPDGRYGISWPERADAEKANYDVSNHLVDLQTGQSIGLVADGDGDFEGRNHGGLRILWRDDSQALVYRLEGKWAPRWVAVIEIDPAGQIRETGLIQPAAAALSALLTREAPDIWDRPVENPAEYCDINIGCAFNPGGDSLAIRAEFEMNPKQIPGQTYAAGWLTGTFDLKTGQLTVAEEEVTDARVVKEEEESESR